jgi:hypothetical protein
VLNSLKTWFGEVTTGHGVMILSGTLLSVLSGGMTWAGAAPLLAAGVIGLIWPENTTLQTAGKADATDLVGVVSAYDRNKALPPRPGSDSKSAEPPTEVLSCRKTR